MKRILIVLSIVWIINWIFVVPASARRDIPDDNLAYPVLLQRQEGGGGSGFYLRSGNQLFLVTARHVLFRASKNTETGEVQWEINSKASIKAISYGKDPEDSGTNILVLDLQALHSSGNLKNHNTRDVAIIRIGSMDSDRKLQFTQGINLLARSNSDIVVTSLENTGTFSRVLVSNEVFLFGFPLELGLLPLNQYDYSKPLLRKGIVAGKNSATKTLMIDLPAYHGNSGGPILEVEIEGFEKRFRIIGVLSQLVPVSESVTKYGITTQVLSHSGYSVAESIDPVLELAESFLEKK